MVGLGELKILSATGVQIGPQPLFLDLFISDKDDGTCLFVQYPFANSRPSCHLTEASPGLITVLGARSVPGPRRAMAMLRNRLLILAGGCFLAASAAKADGVAYIDCSTHPDDTQVFGKPRRTPESVASVRCGERFTILLYGFIFSRIQTKDGQIGYVYSNLISVDHSGASVQQPSAARPPAATSNPPATTTPVAQPNATAPAQATPAGSAQLAPTETPAVTSKPATTTAATGQPNSAAPAQPQATSVAPAQPLSTQVPVATSKLQDTAAAVQVSPTASVQIQPTTEAVPMQGPASTPPAQAAAAQSAQIEATAASVSVRETPAAVEQPNATPAVQPEPTPAEPAPAAIRPVSIKESWEKPNPGVRTVGLRKMPLIELFGGYGFARLDGGGGTGTNLNGVLGSFGWNAKPWLQIVADSSYDVVTVSGVKTVLYGNHWGPRIFFRRVRNRWGATPFVEGLAGGSRADTTVSGTGGYSTSVNCFSFKVGGGLDIKPSRHLAIRLFDVDYYRTSFGPNLHQNNYWASAGIVLRLFGGSE
jgi:hypothetical protein